VNIADIPPWCSNGANRKMTLELSVRMPNDSTRPSNTGVLQFFQYGGKQYGPALRLLWTEEKGFYLRKQTSDDPLAGTYPVGSSKYVEKYEEIRLGRIGIGRWVHFKIYVYWTADPSLGVIAVWVDGVLKGTMKGQTIKNVRSSCTSDSRVGSYSGAGVVDFDNLQLRVRGSGPKVESSRFALGEKLYVSSGPIIIRNVPAGAQEGDPVPTGTRGTVVGGPMYVRFSGTNGWWWHARFDNGYPGWAPEVNLGARHPR
jgi:hypothetical protein